MADVNSNININFNTAAALAQLRQLQAGLSKFHQSLAEGNLAAANAQKGLNAQLLQSVGATGKFSASQVKVAGSTLAFTSALEKNKLSLREYYRYTMAAATANTRVMGKAFAQEREIINRARRDRVKALQSQYIQMNKANAGFMDAIKIMPKSLAMASGKFTELGTRIQYAAQRQQFLNQLLKQGSTQLLNFGKNTQWAGRQLMVGLTMPLALFGASAAKTFRELEAEIVKFKRVYGNAFTNDAETDAAVENIRKLATEYTKYGVSVTKTMEMAGTAAAAGFVGNDLSRQVEAATKLSVLGQVEQQQALETTISLQSAFGLSSEELAKKIDFLNAVENQTLLSIEDLTIAIPKAAPVIKQLGGNVEDLAFFMTAMKEGGINASEGANALKSGLASLINPSKKAAGFLADLGINVKGIVEGNQGDIKATVIGFSQALDTLDPLNRARAIEQMFGKFQFARLSTLFQNVAKDGTQASRALDLAGSTIEELAVLSEREMKKIEDSVGVKFQAAIEQFKQEIMPIGKIFLEALTPVVKFFGGLFEKFNGLSDNTKKVVAIIAGVVAGLGPILLMTFGLLANGVANVIKFFAMLRGGIAKLNGQTSMLGAGFNYMTQEQIESAAASQQLHQTHTRLIEVFNVEKASVNALASSYNSLSTQMRSMAAANPSLFAGGAPGAARAVTKLPPARKYKDGVLSVPGPKGAGDVVPAMLSPGEAVIPTETTDKYRGLISAMFQDKVPGFMAGRLPGGPGRGIPLSDGPAAVRKAQQAKYRRRDDARQGYNEPHPEASKGPVFVGMPKSIDKTSQSRQIVDKISEQVSIGRFGTLPPSNFGTLLQPFSGRSFPVPGVGGIYRKPNGKIVVVKPTIDEKTALAEVRATEIAREVHGLVSPKQSIRTMIDPTDPSGQRKFIVIESPYDPRIAQMDGKFSKSDMVKQLVASTLRGDKDLQQPNLSGNVLADVGTAGVFDRASGFRDFSKSMPSMEEQAVVNLLGVKGGAKKFFAQETSSLAASMTPAQYDAAIKGEINRSVPRLEKLIKSWSGDLGPEEQIVYNNMLERLKAGAKTDWDKLQPVHARAGEGIKKAIEGVDPDAQASLIREQVGKYGSAAPAGKPNQSEQALERFIAEMDEEYSNHSDPAKRKKYIDKKSNWHDLVKKFQPGPDPQTFVLSRTADGSLTRPFTLEEARSELRYAMGDLEKNGSLTNRGHTPGTFRRGLEGFGKVSTGAPSHVKTALRHINKENPSGEVLQMKKVMDDLKIKHNLNDKQLKKALQYESAHIVPSGFKSTDPRNWQHGQVFSEFGVANNFLNTVKDPKNFEKLLSNPKTMLPVSEGGLGYTEARVAQLKRDLFWASSNKHPTTPDEFAKLVRLAEFNTLAAEGKMLNPSQMKSVYQAEAVVELGKIRQQNGFFNDFHKRVVGLTTEKEVVRYNSEKEYLDAQKALAKKTGKDVVAARKGESVVNKKTKTVNKIKSKNSSPIPDNVIPIDKNGKRTSDNVLVKKRQSETITTPSQTRQLIRVRGFDDGDKTVGRRTSGVSNPTVRQGQIASQMRSAGYSQQEIDKTIRKIQKKELEAKQSSANSAAKEARAQKEQAAVSKRQTEDARKRFKENQRRAELNRQMALNFDAAEKEDRDRTLKNNKEKQKQDIKNQRMARQQKIGVASGGAAMGLGMAGSGLMMSGNMGGGMALMGASAVAGMAPMLAGMGPIGWITTAAVTIGAGLFLLDKSFRDSAKKQSAFANQTSATADKMKKIGEITGQVGATEAMDKRRSSTTFDSFSKGYDRAGQQFGTNFMSSEVGKDISKGFGADLSLDRGTAVKKFALQLSQYVSDGVITGVQAGDIARQLSVDFKDMSLYPSIVAQLTQLIGPDGTDLLKDPMKIRVLLSQEQTNIATNTAEGIQTKNKARGATDLLGFNSNAGDKVKANAAQSALTASMYVKALETNKANIDATNVQYEKDRQVLNQKLLIAKTDEERSKIQKDINALSVQNQADNKKLSKETAKTLLAQQKAYDKTSRGAQGLLPGQINFARNSFLTASKEQVKSRYAGTALEKDVNPFLEKTASLKSTDLEVRINAIAAAGTNPLGLVGLMNMFGEDEQGLKKELDLGIKTRGADKTVAMLQNLGIVEDEAVRKELFLKINAISDDTQFGDVGATLTKIAEMEGKDFDINTYLKGNAFAKLKDLSERLRRLQDLPDPIEKTAISSVIEKSTNPDEKASLSAVVANWEYFMTLPKEIRKTAITTMITAYDMTGADQIDAEIEKRAKAAGNPLAADRVRESLNNPTARAKIQSELALAATKPQYNPENKKKTKIAKTDETKTGGKDNPLKFLDSLAMRLKQVRDNAFDAMKPVDSLLAAFRDKKTQNNAFKLFDGIQNRLLRMGVGKDMRDAVASMSAEDFAKVAALTGDDAIFTFEKNKPRSKDTISGLTDTGKAADQGYREANLGDFNLVNEETVKIVQDQDKAYRILISSGLTAAQALEVVSDEGQAAALAAGAISTSDPEWKTYIANIKAANDALERQDVLNKAIKANEEFAMYKKMPELVSQMKALGYSTDQIDAVLGDPQLAKFLVEDLEDGKLDAKEIAETLNNIEARKIIDIQVKLNQGDLAGAAAEGRDIVDDLFAAQEGLIRTGPEAMQLKANERQIRDLEGQIAPFQRRIEELNDQIEDGQRAIEENYTRPIDDLSEEVNDLNRELEMNPLFGDRAIKKIQDENNMLSNDLEIINKAAEEVNKKYDEQAEALSKVQEINQNIIDQQKQQIGLADALTQGDISAAAQAAQDIRATSASQFASGQSDALEQARKNALGSLVGPESGLTAEQIGEKQFQNSQKIYQMETDPRRLQILDQIQIKQDAIYNLEEKREAALRKIRDLEDQIWKIEEYSIEPLQEKIDSLNYANRLLQDSIDKQIEGLTVLGKTRDEWDRINAQLDAQAAALRAANGSAALAGLLAAAEQLNLTWAEILAKLAQYASGVPGAVTAARGAIGGVGGDAYVAPEDDEESLAAFETFLATVEALDAATAAYDAAVELGNMYGVRNAGLALAEAQAAYDATLPEIDPNFVGGGGGTNHQYLSGGGLIKPQYFARGGFARGLDTVPAMLTPGEFVMSRYAVQSHGIDKMKTINNGSSVGDSVYNYSISVNVKSDANPDEIARVVMTQIKGIDSQKLRGNRF